VGSENPTHQEQQRNVPLPFRQPRRRRALARSAAIADDSWMSSDGHRRNILSEGSSEIGVGFIDSHWVQVFGYADRSAEE
jgi:uncharacterized protein YkwD